MQIKQRVKKLESQIAVSDPRFCTCDKKSEIHVLEPSVSQAHYCIRCEGICRLDKDAPCANCGKTRLFETITVKPRTEGEDYEH